MATPYDWGIDKYNGLLREALEQSTPMFDYQATLDTLKALRDAWLEGYEAGAREGKV